MASIKAIQQRSVHQIQSGQVIVDLNSVVKELVENSIDAGSTSIEVRFRNHGLDAIEVVDNGVGISPDDYESVALKHHTSKLSTYDDLQNLNTFGFRGEALASLCALSQLHIITARDVEAPKGRKLEFEMSGKLKTSSVVAAQRGTKVVIESLFHNLPVRRKELEKNIKREYGKVLSLLQAYACISTGIRFVVSNQMPKAGKNVAFSTGINGTTKDNITNVFGARTLHALVKLDLRLEMIPSTTGFSTQASSIIPASDLMKPTSREVKIEGHISRPVLGEGRQAPDRQFLFVNSRPCGLPQVAKAFNEVYKSFNVSQSPFIFANLVMDTQAYDVNVSPDKRTILLHDQHQLLESLKEALTELFEAQEQSVPQSKLGRATQVKLSSYQQTTSPHRLEANLDKSSDEPESTHEARTERHAAPYSGDSSPEPSDLPLSRSNSSAMQAATESDVEREKEQTNPQQPGLPGQLIHDWLGREVVDREKALDTTLKPQKLPHPAPVPNAFSRMRPPRTPAQIAEITIGNVTTSTVIGSGSSPFKRRRIHTPRMSGQSRSLLAFAMPGSQLDQEEEDTEPGQESCENDEDEAEEEDGDRGEDEDGQGEEEEDHTPSEGAGIRKNIDVDQREEKHSGLPFIEESTDEEAAMDDLDRPAEQGSNNAATDATSSDSDGDYMDEQQRRNRDDARIARLIHKAEEAASHPSVDNLKRAHQAMRGTAGSKHSVLALSSSLGVSLKEVQQQTALLSKTTMTGVTNGKAKQGSDDDVVTDDVGKADAEAQLSLTVSKPDFGRMSIAGQFNLGFIIALRPNEENGDDDMFIVDQHAADEKFNFERFTRSLNLEPQRLAQPKQLYLTAVEEEIILAHSEALAANGFIIETDTSGASAVGERCKLLCLPMSRETTFDLSDLEELLHLLSDHSSGSSAQNIPRPTKVRKMLAMRACRSSIMVGKTLTKGQMQKVVRNLGEMDKPWNCPHGRPTMRHLATLGGWQGWDEVAVYQKDDGGVGGGDTDWSGWLRKRKGVNAE